MWVWAEPTGVDWTGHGPEKAQALFQIPDPGAGEGVPLQRLRLKAEEVGAGAKPQPYRTAGQNMVPEPQNEKQEKLPAASSATKQQLELRQ